MTTNMNQISEYSFNKVGNNHPEIRIWMGYNSVPFFVR